MLVFLVSLYPWWPPCPRWWRGGRCWKSPWWWRISPASSDATRRPRPRTWSPWWTPARRRPPSLPQSWCVSESNPCRKEKSGTIGVVVFPAWPPTWPGSHWARQGHHLSTVTKSSSNPSSSQNIWPNGCWPLCKSANFILGESIETLLKLLANPCLFPPECS